MALNKKIKAPVKKGDKVGKAKIFPKWKEIGSIDIVAAESVDEISYKSAMGDTVKNSCCRRWGFPLSLLSYTEDCKFKD